MKKLSVILLSVVLLFCVSCSGKKESGETYLLYFPEAEGTFSAFALGSEERVLDEGAEPISSLLSLLILGPEGEDLVDVFPTGVRVRNWHMENDILYVDFTSRYGLLSGIDLTLADYSVTMTLSQLEEVSAVVTTVEGDRATYRDKQKMGEDDVVLLEREATEPQT